MNYCDILKDKLKNKYSFKSADIKLMEGETIKPNNNHIVKFVCEIILNNDQKLVFDQIISINDTSIISQIMNEAYSKCRSRDDFKVENNSILEYYDGKIKFVGYIPILLEFYRIVENYYQNNSKLRSAGTNCR